ncbi:30S ribosomal protein S4 [Candidatus Micrarchaeota archaeon]|nr:30S ribosomal protein S4 [Candidatus Micrarchaeota archaeon]
MGDPRKLRDKFERPKKLWDKDRIRHDSALKTEFGLKNSSEIWRASGELKKYRREARRLLSITEEERKDDAEKILRKLARLGIMKEGSELDDILGLEVRSVLERRLQTMVVRKGLARTMRQARQLVTHGFIGVGGRKVTRPGYAVKVEEEPTITHVRAIDISVRPEEEAKEEAAEVKAEEKEETKEKPAEEAKPEKEKPSEKPEGAAA